MNIRNYDYLKNTSFLEELIKEKVKIVYSKVVILDKEELPLETIEGQITSGSINIQGSSSVRRTGSLTFITEEKENNLTNIDNILSINKKIKIFVGIENNINIIYDKIIWFPLGIFVITQPNISHNLSGVTVSLSFKDKMCLLNGECGGTLPTSITFHEYDQVIGYKYCEGSLPAEANDYTIYEIKENNESKYYSWSDTKGWQKGDINQVGKVISRPQPMFNIVQTLVLNYGNENPAKIFINDIPLEIKSSVRYTGSKPLYYSEKRKFYSFNQETFLENNEDTITEFNYNDDIGYVYTSFTYPGELVSGIGENVCSVLDKVRDALGNYEYFYDVEGNFIFQEIKNYLNKSFEVSFEENDNILNNENYQVGFNTALKTVYNFEENNGLINSFSNTPNYLNIKNNFHVWGKNNDGLPIHYHVAIKSKPVFMNKYDVVFLKDENDEYTGQLRLKNSTDIAIDIVEYEPTDWRAELYLQGLRKRENGQRPDIFEQELLDNFDSIYNFKENRYKADITRNPNSLKYYIDFLEPVEKLHNCSIDALGLKTYSHQQDKVNRLYNKNIPNLILINNGYNDITKSKIHNRCKEEEQSFSNVTQDIYTQTTIGTSGYTAYETMRELLYQYTDYSQSISITSIPIYYLDVNNRISIYDKASNIYGDYIINSISLPLDAKGTMSISATRALERI